MDGRPYQLEMVNRILEELLERDLPSTAAVMATGTGKTWCTGLIAARWPRDRGRVLFLVHRDELLWQARDTLRDLNPDDVVELEAGKYYAQRGAESGDLFGARSRIVVASKDTLWRPGRLHTFDPGEFGLIVTDEAHHCVPHNKTYWHIRRYFAGAKNLGITATPDRSDGQALGQAFASVAYAYNIVQAIEDGWLVPVVQQYLHVQGYDLSSVKSLRGDYTDQQLDDMLHRGGEKVLGGICHPVTELSNRVNRWGAGRPCLIFAPSVPCAIRMAEILNRHHASRGTGLAAAIADEKTDMDQRRAIVAGFRRGEIRYLVNYGVLCLDAETEILTDSGWVGMDAMTPMHRVANYVNEGQDAGTIYFKEPLHIVRRDRFPGERMVTAGGTRHAFRVTEDHRMLAGSLGSNNFRIRHARDVVGKRCRMPAAGYAAPVPFAVPGDRLPERADFAARVRANAYHLRKQGMPPAVARAEAERRLRFRLDLERSQAGDLSWDDCAFIGFFLAEGTRTELSSGGVEFKVSQSPAYPKIIAWFDAVVSRMGLHVRRTVHPETGVVSWAFNRGTSADALPGLFRLEPWLNKNGGQHLFALLKSQFDALLRGFWFGDGDHLDGSDVPPSLRVCNTNKSLLDSLQAVAVCRGWRASMSRRGQDRGVPGHAPLWRVTFSPRQDYQFAAARPRFEEEWKPERVWCVTSETGNIVTRRRGVVLITGNTEGFDAPETRMVVVCRATKSRSLYAQMVGRGTRPCDDVKAALDAAPDAATRRAAHLAGHKPTVLVVDPVGVSGEHKLITSCADLLGGWYDDETIEAAKDAMAGMPRGADGQPAPSPVSEALRQAAEQLAERERERRKALLIRADYSLRTVDPFDVLDVSCAREPFWLKGKPASDKQLAVLRGAGLKEPQLQTMSMHRASRLIDDVVRRRTGGLATLAQAMALRKYGYSGEQSFDEARAILDGIAELGWPQARGPSPKPRKKRARKKTAG